MANVWVVSIIAQWFVIVSIGVVVLAHSRLLGLLHFRLGPSGARPLADGPTIGTKLEKLHGRLIDGSEWTMGFPNIHETMLVFISPQCQSCNTLLLHAKDYARTYPQPSLIIISTIDNIEMNRAYIAFRKLGGLSYVLGESLAKELDIEGTPYALRLDRRGQVVAKGVVNSFENLAMLRSQPDPSDPTAHLALQEGDIVLE